MPPKLETALKRRAAQLGMEPGSPRYKRYVFGTLDALEKRKKESDGGQSDRPE